MNENWGGMGGRGGGIGLNDSGGEMGWGGILMIYAILQTILNLFLFVLGLLCVFYMIGVMVESNESNAAKPDDKNTSDADEKPSSTKPVLIQPPKTSGTTTTRTPESIEDVDNLTPTPERYREVLYHLVGKLS